VIAVFALIGVAVVMARVLPSRANKIDFAHYYVTTRLWLDGRDPYSADFSKEFPRYGFVYDPRIRSAGNAPPLVVAFAPFAAVAPRTGFIMWLLVEIGALAACLWMIVREVGNRLPKAVVPPLVAALAISRVTYRHFYFSQVQLVVGALLVGAYLLQRRGRFSLAWVSVAVASLLKLFPALLFPWFVLSAEGTIRQKASRLIPAAVVCLVTLGITHGLWNGFRQAGVGVIARDVASVYGNYSIPSFVVHVGWLLYGNAPSDAQAAGVWRAATIVGGAFCVALYAWWWIRRLAPEDAFCMLLIGCVLASPTAWEHYFVLLFFPFAVFVAAQLRQRSLVGITAAMALYVYVFLLADLPFLARSSSYLGLLIASYAPTAAASCLLAWFAARRETGTAVPRGGAATRLARNHAASAIEP
jgi:hypothetical protein